MPDLSKPNLDDVICVIQRAPVFSLFYTAKIVRMTKTTIQTTDMLGGNPSRFHRETLHSMPYGDGKYITATVPADSERMRPAPVEKLYRETLETV